MKQLFSRKLYKVSLFVVIGGLAGFAYYYYVGCQTGTCPITRNPYISTSYGMLIGLLISIDSKKKSKKDSE